MKRKCIDDNCNKQPSFGLEKLKPLYCSEHKLDNMKNVQAKTCLHDTCYKQPCFGLEKSKPLYCSEHKLDKMKNVKDKTCLDDNCDKYITCQANYILPKELNVNLMIHELIDKYISVLL